MKEQVQVGGNLRTWSRPSNDVWCTIKRSNEVQNGAVRVRTPPIAWSLLLSIQRLKSEFSLTTDPIKEKKVLFTSLVLSLIIYGSQL